MDATCKFRDVDYDGHKEVISFLTDFDECSEFEGELCAHICTNTIDSYYCSCRQGFQLQSDGKSCHLASGKNRFVRLILLHGIIDCFLKYCARKGKRYCQCYAMPRWTWPRK